MKIEKKAHGDEYNFSRESDIIEVFASISGLRVVVNTSKQMFDDIFLEVFFAEFRCYRFLDAGDLIAYWEDNKFSSSHHVYEITAGGWLRGEPLLNGIMSGLDELGVPEWFILTSNGCISVLGGEPEIRETLK